MPLCYDKQYFPLHRERSGSNADLSVPFPTSNITLTYLVKLLIDTGPVMIAF